MVRLQGAWSGRRRVEKTHQALDEERLGQLHTSELMPHGLFLLFDARAAHL